MPNWLNNTLYVIILILSMGCVTQGWEWKTNKKSNAEEDAKSKE